MIQLITCGPDNGLNRKLTTIAHASCRALQVDSETLLETLHLKEVADSITEAESTTLCTLVYNRVPQAEESQALASAVQSAAHESLLIAMLKDPGHLADIINAGTQLSGVMVAPLNQDTAHACYRGVLERYQRRVVKTSNAIVLQYGRQSYQLDVSSILYLEALNKMVNVHTMMQCITVSQSLKEVLAALDDRFFQCHRSYVVNTHAIEEVNYPQMELRLVSGAVIPFSRANRQLVMEKVKPVGV